MALLQKRAVEKKLVHEDVEFGPGDDPADFLALSLFESDIGLLKLKEPVVLNERVKLI